MKVLMTGATGLVGKEVGKGLIKAGHEIYVVTRDRKKAQLELPFPCQFIEGDLNQDAIRDERINEIEAVIHLAGESVAGYWTNNKKKKIYNSRVVGTQNLVATFQGKMNLKIWIGASAIGLYGNCGDSVLTEESARGNNFLSQVVVDWEKALPPSFAANLRTVILRIGVVLSEKGGALPQMIEPLIRGVGSPVGGGDQYMSWISLSDLSELILWSLNHQSLNGIFNAVADEPIQQKDLAKQVTSAVQKWMLPNVPGAIFKTILGEMSSLLLDSQRVSNAKIKEAGFKFKHSNIMNWLKENGSHWLNGEELLVAEQYLPYSRDQVFAFFMNAYNLEKITPPTLNFKIEKISTEKIGQGTLIDYKLKIHGVPASWQTLIDEWDPDHRFVDTQLKGPYSLWHHTHLFSDLGKGTLMVDRVRYRLPLGFLGWAVAGAFVKSDVAKIFAYRRMVTGQKI
jgi:uncharacterized protein